MTASVFPEVTQLMEAQGMNYSYIAHIVGVDIHYVIKKLRGERMLKLWEAIEIKRALKTDMPVEELFREGGTK